MPLFNEETTALGDRAADKWIPAQGRDDEQGVEGERA
jgi:hypothetical protein